MGTEGSSVQLKEYNFMKSEFNTFAQTDNIEINTEAPVLFKD